MTNASFDDDRPLLEGVESIPAGAFSLPEPREGLRSDLLRRTSRVVRRRRMRRYCLRAVAVAAIYASGVFTTWFVGDDSDQRSAADRPPIPEGASSASTMALGDTERLPRDPRHLEERLLEADEADAREILRAAGDRYLESDYGDVEAALYCYRRLLGSSNDANAVEPKTEDSWLLTYLKLARIETRH